MNKAFYISSIALSFIFLCVCGYYIGEVESARSAEFSSYLNSYTDTYNYGYSSYNPYEGYADEYTTEAAIVSIFFFLFFIATDILGIAKIKTTTIKALGIIGLCLSGLMLMWDFLILSSPSSLSFDEVGGAFAFYALIILAFSIVGLVQAVLYSKGKVVSVQRTDILDM